MTKKGESNSLTDPATSAKEGRPIDTNNPNGKEDLDGRGSEVQLMYPKPVMGPMSPNPVIGFHSLVEILEQKSLG